MKQTIRIIAASAFITGMLIKAVPAVAEPLQASNVSIVHTTDLDLSSTAGVRELNRRLSAAARTVCGTASDADLEGKNEVRACRSNVLGDARNSADRLIATREVGATITVAAR